VQTPPSPLPLIEILAPDALFEFNKPPSTHRAQVLSHYPEMNDRAMNRYHSLADLSAALPLVGQDILDDICWMGCSFTYGYGHILHLGYGRQREVL